MKKDKVKHQNGFTLVELIVVMAIMGFLTASTIGLVQSGGNFFQHETAKSDAEKAVRLVFSSIDGMVRRSDVENAISVETISAASLALRIRNADTGRYYWYYLDGGDMKMRRRETTGTDFGSNVLETLILSAGGFTAFTPSLSGNVLQVDLDYSLNGEDQGISSVFLLRSEAN